jgi:hypothetical protein
MNTLNDLVEYVCTTNPTYQKDVNIFPDILPDTPDACVAVFEYTSSPVVSFSQAAVRSFQVVIRDKSSRVAKVAIWSIYKSLFKEDLFIQIGTRKALVSMRNTPCKIDVDSQNRTLWAFNLALTIDFN